MAWSVLGSEIGISKKKMQFQHSFICSSSSSCKAPAVCLLCDQRKLFIVVMSISSVADSHLSSLLILSRLSQLEITSRECCTGLDSSVPPDGCVPGGAP